MSRVLRSRLTLLSVILAAAALVSSAEPIRLLTPAPDPSSTTAAGDSTAPALSADGQRVVFLSTADDLVSNDGNGGAMDVFVRDLTSDETLLISVALDGTSGNRASSFATISGDGRYVVFVSEADNLVESDTNGVADVFLRDLQEGTTRLVSRTPEGRSGAGASGYPSISADGRWIVFESDATDLVAGDANGTTDIFLYDQETAQVGWLSGPASDPAVALRPSGPSNRPVIAADGGAVLFRSLSLNLAPEVLAGGWAHINQLHVQRPLLADNRMVPLFPSDAVAGLNLRPLEYTLSADGRYLAVQAARAIGGPFPRAIYWVDLELDTFLRVAPDLVTASANDHTGLGGPHLSADGQVTVFEARTPVGEGTTRAVVWAWQTATGETERISSGGLIHEPGTDPSTADESPFGELAAVCPQAEYIAFLGGDPVDPPSLSPIRQLMVRHRPSGELRRVSRTLDGGPVESLDYPAVGFSADGRRLVFQTGAAGLVENDHNAAHDIFLYDWAHDSIQLISVRHPEHPSATPLGGWIAMPSQLSADGRFLAHVSLDAGSTDSGGNDLPQVRVLDLLTGSNRLASVNASGNGPGNRTSSRPVLSTDGRRVAFVSLASDLVPGDVNDVEDVFVRDLESNLTLRAGRIAAEGDDTAAVSMAPAISPDGAWVAFERSRGVFNRRQVLLFEVGTQTTRLVSARTSDGLPSAADAVAPQFSGDGRFVIFGSSGGDLLEEPLAGGWRTYAYEITTGELRSLSVNPLPVNDRIWFSDRPTATDASGRWVVGPAPGHLVIHDLETHQLTPVATNAANARLSADGRWVAYEWTPTAPLSFRQIRVADWQAQETLLVSATHATGQEATGNSTSPWISPDGRFVAFLSRARDLVEADAGRGTQLFLWDRVAGRCVQLTTGTDGSPATGKAYAPVLAADGRTLVFASFAHNLVEQDLNRQADLYRVVLPGAESGFRITTVTRLPAGLTTIHWAADPDRTYRLEYAETLAGSAWQRLDVPILIGGGQAVAEDPSAAGKPRRFYRIASEPALEGGPDTP